MQPIFLSKTRHGRGDFFVNCTFPRRARTAVECHRLFRFEAAFLIQQPARLSVTMTNLATSGPLTHSGPRLQRENACFRERNFTIDQPEKAERERERSTPLRPC